MTTTTAAAAPPATRLHGLDSLRATALGLGIVLHSLAPFVPDLPWLFLDSRTTPLAGVTSFWIHLFRMVLFMLLAGYFGRMVVHRRGPRSYLRDRALRIALPVVAFWPVAVMPLGVLAVVGAQARGQEVPEMTPPETSGVDEVLLLASPGQLWFLVVLVQCVLVALAVRAVGRAVLGAERSGRLSRRVGELLVAPAGLLLAVVPYAVALLLQGTALGGLHTPPTILPTPASIAYLGAFAVGWCLHAAPGSLDRLATAWPAQLGAAVVLAVVANLVEVSDAPLVLRALAVAAAGWAWTFGLVGLFMRFLHRENPVVRYLADSSYWSYLLHLPVVVAVGLAMADLAWPISVKLAVTWAVTAAVLLLSYDLLVRSTWVGRWLNGRRHPRVLLARRRTAEPASP